MPALVTDRIRGVVFDLWNTLVYNDHRPNPIVALARSFGILGRPGWTKIIERGMMREPMRGIREGIASLSREIRVSLPPEEVEFLCSLWQEAGGKTRLFDDVIPTLTTLSTKFGLGLLSNTQSFDLEFLEETGLARLFRARALSCEEGFLKPDPVLFFRISERLSLPPSRILLVGDNLHDDILAAESVGMQAVLLRRGEVPLSFREQPSDREPLRSLPPLREALGL